MALVENTCYYVRDYAKSLEANRSGYATGLGKWNAIKTTMFACYTFYSSAKKITGGQNGGQITDNCVIDLGKLARAYFCDLTKIALLHEPTTDDVDLMAKVRAFEIAIAESTRIYLKQLRQKKRELCKRKFGLSDGKLSYLTYKIDQVMQINKQVSN
jgi:hypothetical protein